MDDPSVSRRNKEGLIIYVPESAGSNFGTLFLIGEGDGEISDAGDAIGSVAFLWDIEIKERVEIVDLDPAGSVGLVLIVQEQEAFGPQVELDLLQFEDESDILDGAASLDLEDLLKGRGTSREPSFPQATR
jgi:hypothetical protein